MPLPKREFAASFLPDRYRYWYSLSKLAMDPLYEAVPASFGGEPVLDPGCGRCPSPQPLSRCTVRTGERGRG